MRDIFQIRFGFAFPLGQGTKAQCRISSSSPSTLSRRRLQCIVLCVLVARLNPSFGPARSCGYSLFLQTLTSIVFLGVFWYNNDSCDNETEWRVSENNGLPDRCYTGFFFVLFRCLIANCTIPLLTGLVCGRALLSANHVRLMFGTCDSQSCIIACLLDCSNHKQF